MPRLQARAGQMDLRLELVVSWLVCLVMCPIQKIVVGQNVSCSGLNDLINNVNRSELSRCVRLEGCSGFQCVNRVKQLRQIVELFNFTLLPCRQPSPALLVQLLGQVDPVIDNMRREVYKEELVNNTVVPISSGGIVLGTYDFLININTSTRSIGIEIRRGAIKVLNYTIVEFNFADCPPTTFAATTFAATTSTTSAALTSTTDGKRPLTTFTTPGQFTGGVKNTTSPSSNGSLVGGVVGATVSVVAVVITTMIITCIVLLVYGYTHQKSKIGHAVRKLIRQNSGKEYTDQVAMLDLEVDGSIEET